MGGMGLPFGVTTLLRGGNSIYFNVCEYHFGRTVARFDLTVGWLKPLQEGLLNGLFASRRAAQRPVSHHITSHHIIHFIFSIRLSLFLFLIRFG